MAPLLALLSRLDPDERVRGRQWERLCAWYLTHEPAYRSQVRRGWHTTAGDQWQPPSG